MLFRAQQPLELEASDIPPWRSDAIPRRILLQHLLAKGGEGEKRRRRATDVHGSELLFNGNRKLLLLLTACCANAEATTDWIRASSEIADGHKREQDTMHIESERNEENEIEACISQ